MQLNWLGLDLGGIREEGQAEATPSYHPMGPSPWGLLGLSSPWSPRGRLALSTGSGRLGQEGAEPPAVGARGGRFGVAQNSPTQGGAQRGVGHPPHGLLSNYKPGNKVPRVCCLSVCTRTCRLIIPEVESDHITRGNPLLTARILSSWPQTMLPIQKPSPIISLIILTRSASFMLAFWNTCTKTPVYMERTP